MEADILKSLKFELGGHTINTFLSHVCFIDSVPYVEWFCFSHSSFSLHVGSLFTFVFAEHSLELLKRVLM